MNSAQLPNPYRIHTPGAIILGATCQIQGITLYLAALVILLSDLYLSVSTTERLTRPNSGWLAVVNGSVSTGNHCQVTPIFEDCKEP